MFRGLKRLSNLSPLGMQANALGSALQGRMNQPGGTMSYMDDSLPAQSAQEGMTMQSVLKQRRQQQRPQMMQGMGGMLGGKF